jgi:radical SAM protein with 4Fe4S-binding SPASM domain
MQRVRQENHLFSALLELTYKCNLACQFCYNDLGAVGQPMALENYKTLIDDLKKMGTLSITLSGGEPLVHPDFFELGAYARSQGFSITVKSNGVPLNQNNARRLKDEVDPYLVEMSLHGADAKTHDRQTLMVGSFDRMLKNIRFMKSIGFRMRLNSALTKLNEHQVEEMFALTDGLEVPLRFDPQITPRDNGDLSPLLLTASKDGIANMMRITLERSLAQTRSNAAINKQSVEIRVPGKADTPAEADAPKRVKNCGVGSTNIAVDPFGNVYPCVQYRRAVGNLHEKSVREIWEDSDLLDEIRELQARDSAVASKVDNYCLGAANLITGNPLKIHPTARQNDKISKKIRKELA